jgi:hypothetical protein
MKIGFSKIEITPPLGLPLCGQLEPVKAVGVESPLWATAMYLEDGLTKVLLCSCDILAVSNRLAEAIRRDVARETGVPCANVIVCATHTHSGPNTIDIFGKDSHGEYLQELERTIVQVVVEAYHARCEGYLKVSQTQVPGLAFNRRFLMSDGRIQTHPLKGDPHIAEPEGPDSTQMDILYAYDDQNKTRGVLVTFGCHATVMERSNSLISADYPGKIREYLVEQIGQEIPVLFCQGASGNICQVNPRNVSQKEVGTEWCRRMGRALAKRVGELLAEENKQTRGSIRVCSETIYLQRRSAAPELLSWAKKHKTIPASTPWLSDYGIEPYDKIPRSCVSLEEIFATPFWANFYAHEIKTLALLRASEPEVPFTITVVAQDDWALVTLPCELFVEWANAIRETSPFTHTIVVELANGWNGYIPTRKAFERSGGYETKELTSTMLVPEAGEEIYQKVCSMLKALKNKV